MHFVIFDQLRKWTSIFNVYLHFRCNDDVNLIDVKLALQFGQYIWLCVCIRNDFICYRICLEQKKGNAVKNAVIYYNYSVIFVMSKIKIILQ